MQPPRRLVGIFFAAYLAAGLVLAADYGISWDEQTNREFGHRSLDLVASTVSPGESAEEGAAPASVVEYGPAFEILLAAVERAHGSGDEREIFVLRHRATFIAFWSGIVAFYFVLRRALGDGWLALLGSIALALVPRLFADSFYNSKDAVLAALFAIAMLTGLRFHERPSTGRALVHALVCGIAIDVRLVSLLLPALTLAMFAAEATSRRREGANRDLVRAALVFAAALAAFVLLFWPQIRQAPLREITDAIGRVSEARQLDNAFALYDGSFVPVADLPWHYLPTWIGLTMPPWLLALAFVGVVACTWRLARFGPLHPEGRPAFLLLLLVVVPLGAAMALRPVLYDGWRHFYFVTPALVGLGFVAVRDLARRPGWRAPLLGFVVVGLVTSAFAVARHHPHQQVYFNVFAPDEVHRFYEVDYWGLSYRDGLEEILRRDRSPSIPVAVADLPGLLNAMILPRRERERIRFVPIREARYFVSNHRQPHHHRRFLAGEGPYAREVFAVRVEDAHLLGVYEVGD